MQQSFALLLHQWASVHHRLFFCSMMWAFAHFASASLCLFFIVFAIRVLCVFGGHRCVREDSEHHCIGIEHSSVNRVSPAHHCRARRQQGYLHVLAKEVTASRCEDRSLREDSCNASAARAVAKRKRTVCCCATCTNTSDRPPGWTVCDTLMLNVFEVSSCLHTLPRFARLWWLARLRDDNASYTRFSCSIGPTFLAVLQLDS